MPTFTFACSTVGVPPQGDPPAWGSFVEVTSKAIPALASLEPAPVYCHPDDSSPRAILRQSPTMAMASSHHRHHHHPPADNLAADLEAAFECVWRKIDGHQAKVRQRRGFIASYWYQCQLADQPELRRSLDVAFIEVCQLARFWADRLDELTAATPDHDAVRQTLRAQLAAIDARLAPLFDPRRADAPTRDERDDVAILALGELFRWHDLDRLAVYLYVFNDEVPPRATLTSEKSRVLADLQACLDRHASKRASLAATSHEVGEKS